MWDIKLKLSRVKHLCVLAGFALETVYIACMVEFYFDGSCKIYVQSSRDIAVCATPIFDIVT